MTRPIDGRRMTVVLGGMLGLVCVAVTTLAAQAWRAARLHRLAAERSLSDFASTAAWSYSFRAQRGTLAAVTPVLFTLLRPRSLAPAEVFREMHRVADSIHRCDCGPELAPRYFFRASLADAGVDVAGDDLPAESVLAARMAIVRAHARRHFRQGIAYVTLSSGGAGAAWIAYYAVVPGDGDDPGAVYGFEVAPASFERRALATYRAAPLLPGILAGPLPNDSIVSVTIVNADGATVFRTVRQYSPRYSGHWPLGGPGDSSLFVHASINPAAAERLLVGGVPRSPLAPLLFTVVCAAGLIVGVFLVTWRTNELARLRADFTSSVSHELRTPLTQILLYGEMLALGRARTREARREAAEVVVREARRLIHLVENVLHFARAERRLVRVQLGECALAPIVEDVAAAFGPVAAARGAVIRLRVQPDIAAVTDADALRHVLLNLLDNAARYGPRGQQITLGAAREGDWVRLWVDDEGPGVPSEERARIWEPFVRLPSAAGTVSAGSGIGLAVVREIVTLLGGRVGVEGAPERGARFFVLLPAVRHSGATAPHSRAEPTEPPLPSDPHRGSVA